MCFRLLSHSVCLLPSMAGGEPKFSYVGRTVTVDKTLFDAFKSKSKGRRSSGLFTAFLQPRDDSENVQDDNGSLTKRRCDNKLIVSMP